MLPGGSGRVKGAGLGPPVGGGRTPPPPGSAGADVIPSLLPEPL